MIDEYKFKVGDEVITSIGETGVITGICKCDMCKRRGFYEPIVKCEDEDDYITITDTDFRNGFRSFYKIGDYVFGNIDFDTLIPQKERILKDLDRINKHMSNLRNALGEKEE